MFLLSDSVPPEIYAVPQAVGFSFLEDAANSPAIQVTVSDTGDGIPQELQSREFDLVSYTHIRAHESALDLVCCPLLGKKIYRL